MALFDVVSLCLALQIYMQEGKSTSGGNWVCVKTVSRTFLLPPSFV